ncbi:hypothetical protein [Leptothoe spongobia]|uniref:Uncharacterized protein n=1 Tax=Leptothoe spongobia TAU-MAC 1115 TaxID=1967444 RepID=A0A947DFX7_9CYAN|nr:hypothetical protein [Leptothoe spongobia]MBT9315674.1 hypothetical protein [Leptothoe spongobia TAU-MAC 1115]
MHRKYPQGHPKLSSVIHGVGIVVTEKMDLITIVLIAIAAITLCINLWTYWTNSRYHLSDFMGASINFHAGNFIVGLLAGLGVALHSSWAWWLGLVILVTCWLGSLPLMWLADCLCRPFRRPHPKLKLDKSVQPYQKVKK